MGLEHVAVVVWSSMLSEASEKNEKHSSHSMTHGDGVHFQVRSKATPVLSQAFQIHSEAFPNTSSGFLNPLKASNPQSIPRLSKFQSKVSKSSAWF